MIPIACCTIAFRTEPVRTLLPELARIGFDAAELFGAQVEGKTDAELAGIRSTAAENSIDPLVLSPYLSFTQGADAYTESVERAGRFIRYCHALGAKKIRTFTDVGPTGIGSDVATQEQWDACVEGLKTITTLGRGIDFVVETHPKTLADTLPATKRLLSLVNARNLHVNFQPTTFYTTSMDEVLEAYRELRPRITHMHLNNRNPEDDSIWIENGVIDYPVFFKEVKKSGYNGSVSLEYCCKGATWERVRSGYEYIAKYLK